MPDAATVIQPAHDKQGGESNNRRFETVVQWGEQTINPLVTHLCPAATHTEGGGRDRRQYKSGAGRRRDDAIQQSRRQQKRGGHS